MYTYLPYKVMMTPAQIRRCERLKQETKARRELRLAEKAKDKQRQLVLKAKQKADRKLAKAVPVKPEQEKLPNRQINLDKCVRVQLDDNTEVYVKEGTDITRIKAKHKKTHKLEIIRTGREWTDEQEQYLKDNYKDYSDKELSNHLGRSPNAILEKRHRLRLLRVKVGILSIDSKIRRMKELIALCEANPSPPVKDGYKRQLMKLSGLR